MTNRHIKTVPRMGETEYPVSRDAPFLLKAENRAFVERRADTRVVESSPLDSLFIFQGFVTLAVLFAGLLIAHSLPIAIIGGVASLALTPLLLRIRQYWLDAHPESGWILEGEVLQSEYIHVVQQQPPSRVEKMGIYYRFVAPGGVVEEGYAEGIAEKASQRTLPRPGAPIRVWYPDNENFELL